MKKEYIKMSTFEIENRIKKFQACYPEFTRKFKAIRRKYFEFRDFLDNFQQLANEFYIKCPDIVVRILGMEITNVSKFFSSYCTPKFLIWIRGNLSVTSAVVLFFGWAIENVGRRR